MGPKGLIEALHYEDLETIPLHFSSSLRLLSGLKDSWCGAGSVALCSASHFVPALQGLDVFN